MEKINEAAATIRRLSNNFKPEIALILGSGLGLVADNVKNAKHIDYKEVPNFPVSKVAGHAGRLVLGEMRGKQVMIMQGRFHFYEGVSMALLAFPVRVMSALGIKKIMITNAAGGINRRFKTGDLMLITDHINFTLTNPLMGKNYDNFGPRFPDTSEIYTPALADLARKIATQNKIDLKEGTYFFMSGPCYETPAEVKMIEILGGDVAGMSTFPEALAACHCGMEVLGLTYVANMGAGISPVKLSHDDVMGTMELIKNDVVKLIGGICENM